MESIETDRRSMSAQLVEGLILLALAAQDQFRVLPTTVNVPDELAALVLDPFEVLGRRWTGENARVDCILLEIERIVDAQPKEFFSDASVRESPVWEDLRGLARAALKEMGVVRTVPQLNFVSFHAG